MNDKSAGLSLLDQFAMAALAGGLGQEEFSDLNGRYRKTPEEIAERAYDIALAMRDVNKIRMGMAHSSAPAAKTQRDDPPPQSVPVSPRAAMTIPEFCQASGGISKAFLYKLLKEGRGPRMMKVGRRKLVTVEAAAEWRRQMEGRNG